MRTPTNKKKVLLIGAGGRGMGYTNIMANEFPNDFEVVAVAEPLDDRRNYIKSKHNIPDEFCFTTWEPLLALPKMADVALIATMDRDHFAPAMAAIEKGYDLLLEKPVAPTPEECRAIERAATEKGVFVLICHVLRYTNFYRAIKGIIDSGEIGRVMNIQHIEGVGNIHQSHSFVRGNWGNSQRSSFMLLQKSCHDMDILAWLVGKKCTAVQSFGSLSYFTEKNAPAGAPARCIDGCPHADTCAYNAVKLYLEESNDTGRGRWHRTAATKLINPTDSDVEHVLRTTEYGKCVYKCNNDVVDHQIVNLQFEDDIIISFTMSAFNLGGRRMRIMGTKGEIEAFAENNKITVYSLENGKSREHDCNSALAGDTIVSGHGGGDQGIIKALKDLLEGLENKSVCPICESCDNHMIAFAAEESRLAGGKLIMMDEFMKRYEAEK